MLTQVLQGDSSFRKLFLKQPDYSFLRVFGSSCYPWLRPYNINKQELRSTQCVLIGYSSTTKAYRCYDRASSKVYVSHYVQFRENVFLFDTDSTFTSSSPPDHPLLGLDPPHSLSEAIRPTTIPFNVSLPFKYRPSDFSSIPDF